MEITELLEKQRKLLEAYGPDSSYHGGVYEPLEEASNELQRRRLEYNKTEEAMLLILALEDELHELLRELNWKPWKKTRKELNFDRLHEELADCWHFLLELTLLFNLQDKLEARLKQTFQKNHERANGAY